MYNYIYDYIQPFIRFEIINDCEDDTYAFYVNLNNSRIFTQWYSKNNILLFNTNYIPGIYSVQYFIKSDSGIKHFITSKLFLNYKTINLDNNLLDIHTINFQNSITPYFLKGVFGYHIIYFPHESSNLFILMPSAVEADQHNMPIFHRWRRANNGQFPGKVICIADPMAQMYPHLPYTAFMGTSKHDSIKEIANFIERFASAHDVKNIIFYGSSAGGFAALSAAAEIRGATAVAINSQTNVHNYPNAKMNYFLQTCFADCDKEYAISNYRYRFDMLYKYDHACYDNKVLLVQNLTDRHHYWSHFVPFATKFGLDDFTIGFHSNNNFHTMLYDMPGGHIGETEEICKEIIDFIL